MLAPVVGPVVAAVADSLPCELVAFALSASDSAPSLGPTLLTGRPGCVFTGLWNLL